MAVVNSDPQVVVKPDVNRSRSTFPLSYDNLDTMRFGEYHPHMCIDGISSDKFPWRCVQDCRSFSLKAPLMQQVKKNMDYIMIPLRAILPYQAERIETIPELGDDVPSDAYTCVSDFLNQVNSVSSALINSFEDSSNIDTLRFDYFYKWLIFVESIFSSGSLLSSLGCHLKRNLLISDSNSGKVYDIDSFFDLVCRDLASALGTTDTIRFNIDGEDYHAASSQEVFKDSQFPDTYHISIRQFLEMIRDTSDWYTLALPSGYSLPSYFTGSVWSFTITSTSAIPIDLARLWAYQLSCAEFFTNDKIDYVYSAELFRQYVFNLISSISGAGDSFSWNGLELPYDYLSSHYFIFVVFSFDVTNPASLLYCLQYFISIFGYKRSLRYVDYFVGARTRPLAVGDVSVPVVGGQVSVIDVTRKIQTQKLLNFVQSVPRKAKDYLRDLFGVGPGHDYHDPLFLAHTSDSIGSQQVENTSTEQLQQKQTITAIFNDRSSNFEFEFEVTEPCIILGLTSFDIKRSYTTTIDRSFFTRDRFDMFIPQLQFVGDQPIYRHELNGADGGIFASPFGYTYHDMQYKIIPDRAQGAFDSDLLPGYAFICDPWKIALDSNIGPDFIRSRPSELDDFYVGGVSGFSLGHYFHFIVVTSNLCDASRPMAANPKIL